MSNALWSFIKILSVVFTIIFLIVGLFAFVSSLADSDSIIDDTDIPVITSERFIAHKSSSFSSDDCCFIIVDTFTGVQYLYVDGYFNGGLCVLYDVNGLPLICDNNAE